MCLETDSEEREVQTCPAIQYTCSYYSPVSSMVSMHCLHPDNPSNVLDNDKHELCPLVHKPECHDCE